MGAAIKMLVVDDSMPMRQVLRIHLSELGVSDVLEAKDGQHALEMLEVERGVALIVLDVNMPRIDGAECLKRLKASPHTAAIPVVMCTSLGKKTDVLAFIRAGAANYIVKPFSKEELAKKIAATLAKLLDSGTLNDAMAAEATLIIAKAAELGDQPIVVDTP